VPTIAGDNFLPERYEMAVDQAPAAGVADGGDLAAIAEDRGIRHIFGGHCLEC
jgi:hypothetical protein